MNKYEFYRSTVDRYSEHCTPEKLFVYADNIQDAVACLVRIRFPDKTNCLTPITPTSWSISLYDKSGVLIHRFTIFEHYIITDEVYEQEI